jgi:hypothetical protein
MRIIAGRCLLWIGAIVAAVSGPPLAFFTFAATFVSPVSLGELSVFGLPFIVGLALFAIGSRLCGNRLA